MVFNYLNLIMKWYYIGNRYQEPRRLDMVSTHFLLSEGFTRETCLFLLVELASWSNITSFYEFKHKNGSIKYLHNGTCASKRCLGRYNALLYSILHVVEFFGCSQTNHRYHKYFEKIFKNSPKYDMIRKKYIFFIFF